MTNVLLLTQVLPYPPGSGPKVRTWNVLKYLVKRHEVTLRAGGGVRVKILNVLVQGLPIVSTSLGCEGIAVGAGRHLLIADTPEGFARAVLRLLEDRALLDELGRNGWRLIQPAYDYGVVRCPLGEWH